MPIPHSLTNTDIVTLGSWQLVKNSMTILICTHYKLGLLSVHSCTLVNLGAGNLVVYQFLSIRQTRPLYIRETSDVFI